MRFLTSCLTLAFAASHLPKAAGALGSRHAGSSTVITYPIPTGVATSNAFDVKVRVPGGPWSQVGLYQIKLAEVNLTTGGTIYHPSSVAYFDFNGTVEVSATYNGGAVKNATIRPLSLDIPHRKSGRSVTFTLTEPRNVYLQVNGDIFGGLNLFTNPIEDDVPTQNSTNVVYYGPGLHTISGNVNVASGQTIYVAGGAVVAAGGFNLANITNASIRGRGILTSSSSSGAISIAQSSDIQLDGLILINMLPRTYEANNVVLSNFRVISSVQYGDGFDSFCSNNILIDRAFLRTSDDSVAIYNHRDNWYGNSTNITLQNSALWADLAHPVNIGTHGDATNSETIDGVTIRNVDILDQHEGQILFQGCIALNAGDNNLLQNILVDDVRVENFRLGQLINFRVMKNSYNTAPGLGIRNVTVRNLSYNGSSGLTSIFAGYNENRTISDVTFQNLTINGKTIYSGMKKPGWYLPSDFIPMFVNEHVTNLTFTA